MSNRRDYNRYEIFTNTSSGNIEQLPFVNIPEADGDKYERWVRGVSRLDIISQRYYGNPFFDFFIVYGNPQIIDFTDIEDGTLLRIPYPLDRVRRFYEEFLQNSYNS